MRGIWANIVSFQSMYMKAGRGNFVVALCWWRVVRYVDGRAMKIVSNGPISKMFPEPNIEEVEEIKMVLS